MKTIHTHSLKAAVLALMLFTATLNAVAESATFGWQTSQRDAKYVFRLHMLGPTQVNKMPDKNGEFKGEFYSRHGEWASELISINKLSFEKGQELKSQKVEFTILRTGIRDSVRTDPPGLEKTEFATRALSFDLAESFVLVFKVKEGADKEGKPITGTEMVLLTIERVFVPS